MSTGPVDPASVQWIAADWGTSRLRVWAMGQGASPLAEARSERGMAGLAPGEFEPALVELVGPWLAEGRRMPVLACGMVGARQGWVEAPYAVVPCAPLAAPVPATTRARGSRCGSCRVSPRPSRRR